MKFSELSNFLLKLESTSKRLEITNILADLFKELKTKEVREATYLILGYLKAPFDSRKFNIADKMVVRILQYTYATGQKPIELEEIEKQYREIGDLGDVAYELAKKNKDKDLEIAEVYQKLLEIAQSEGTGSQETKVKKAALLLKELDPLGTKYVVRMILGTTRLGFTELTVVDALALYLGDKTLNDKIENVYSIYPDIGLIAETIKKHGIDGIENITIEPGVPILSQKPQRYGNPYETMEKMKHVLAEFKFDGTRVQLHMDRKKEIKDTNSEQTELFISNESKFLLKTYTRNLEETTHQYPDIVEAAIEQINADSVILDGEAIGYDRKTGDFLPFQETIQRKRKHDIADTAKNIPLKYFVFDILYLNGKSLLDKPLIERKAIIKAIIKPGETLVVDEYVETKDAEELQTYFEVARDKGLEGLIAKNPNDPYQAGARSFSWVKLKNADEKLLDDSVDCVVLGYYAGKGVRSKFGIGGFLVAIYDKQTDTYKSISKIGTGLKEEDWYKLKALCDKHQVAKLPSNVEMNKMYEPDLTVKPAVVVEIGADEISESSTHTAGYALRFPRLLKFREDKGPAEITTLDEIKQMFKKQRRTKQ